MKINRITMTKHVTMVNNTAEAPVNPDINVKRIPPHKEKLDILIKTFGEKELKRLGILECKTCAERTRVDGADGSGVSFKAHGRIDAEAEGREAASQSARLLICPECGRSYVAGGTANKVTVGEGNYDPSLELLEGLRVDEKV